MLVLVVHSASSAGRGPARLRHATLPPSRPNTQLPVCVPLPPGPQPKPSAPRNLKVTALGAVTFTEPATGAPILSYMVEAVSPAGCSARRCGAVEGLYRCHMCTVRLAAAQRARISPFTQLCCALPAPCSRPSAYQADSPNLTVCLLFACALELQAPPGGARGDTGIPKAACTASPCQLSLTAGVVYKVYATATNAGGESPPAGPVSITATAPVR